MISENTIGVSVIVCCYNSEDRISETIKHLALQLVPETISWEVIIVNNASTDTTVDGALLESQKYDQLVDRFNVINELRPGLSFAREAGANQAKFNYLIFCDDDNWLHQDYVATAYSALSEDNNVGALGGIGFAATSGGYLPEWFESVKSWYAIGEQNSCIKKSLSTCNLWGAGLVTRKRLYLDFFKDFPSIAVDRQGNNLSAGGDTEFCLRLILKGYKTYYLSVLKYAHFIPQERLTENYRNRLRHGFDEASTQMVKYFILIQLQNESVFSRLFFISKITLGYFTTFFGRKSYNAENVKVTLYYGLNIDLGIDLETKNIYKFYISNIS